MILAIVEATAAILGGVAYQPPDYCIKDHMWNLKGLYKPRGSKVPIKEYVAPTRLIISPSPAYLRQLAEVWQPAMIDGCRKSRLRAHTSVDRPHCALNSSSPQPAWNSGESTVDHIVSC